MVSCQLEAKSSHVAIRSWTCMILAISLLVEVVQSKPYLTKPLTNVSMHLKDRVVIELDDYVASDGRELKVSSTSRNIIIKDQLVYVNDTASVETPLKVFIPYNTLEEQILLFQNGLISKKLGNHTEGPKLDLPSIMKLPVNTECIGMYYNEEIERILVLCTYTDTGKKYFAVANIDIYALKLTASVTHSLEHMDPSQDCNLTLKIHNQSLVVYQPHCGMSFVLMSVTSDTLEWKGSFNYERNNIEANFTVAEKCHLLDIMPELPNLYMAVNCTKTKKEYLVKCRHFALDKDTYMTACPNETTIMTSSHYYSQGFFFKRLEPNYHDSDILMYFRFNELSLVSFSQGTKRSIFNLTDFNLDAPTNKIISIEAYIKYLYIVVYDTANQAVSLLTISFYRGYYRKKELVTGKEVSSLFGLQLLAENLSKSTLTYLVLFRYQGTNKIQGTVYQDNKLSMEIVLQERDEMPALGLGSGFNAPNEPKNSMISIPLWINFTTYNEEQLSKIYNFTVNILQDFDESAAIDMAPEYLFFKGTPRPLSMPFSKQTFQGYSPHVSLNTGSWELDSSYVVWLDFNFSTQIPIADYIKTYHVEDNIFVVSMADGMLVYSIDMNITQKKANLTILKSVEKEEGIKFLEGTLHKGVVYVLTTVGKESQILRLYRIERNGSTIIEERKMEIGVSALTVYKEKLRIDVYWKGDDQNRPGLYSCNLDIDKEDISQFKTIKMERYEYFPSDQVPFRMTWPFRNIPFLHVATNMSGNLFVHEIAFEYYRELEAPMNTYQLGKLGDKQGDIHSCSYCKNLLIINKLTKEITGIDREHHLANKTKYFPVQEYGVESIVSKHCDHNNPYLAILAQTSYSHNLVVIVYRIEESNDHALRRVCTVQETSIPKTLSGLAAQIKIHTVNSDDHGAVYIFWFTGTGKPEMAIFTFRLSGPEIRIKDIKDKDQETLSLTLQVYKKPFHAVPLSGSTKIRFIEEDFSHRSEPAGRLSMVKSETYNLEDFYKFDGFFLSSRIENSKGVVDSKQGKFFRDRSSQFQASFLTCPEELTKFIIEKNVIFAWNSEGSRAYIIQDFKDCTLILNNSMITKGFFASDENLDDINSNQYIVAFSRDIATKDVKLHFFWRDSSVAWRHTELALEKGIDSAKAVKTGKYTFAYTGYNQEIYSMTVGYFNFNPNNNTLKKALQSKVEFITDPLDQISCFSAGEKLVLIVKKKHNEVGTIMQYSYNTLFNRVELELTLDDAIFPGIKTHGISKNLYCTSELKDNVTQAVCFMHNDGIQYHVNNITLRMAKAVNKESKAYLKAPNITLINSFKALQGYEVISTELNMKYVVQLVRKVRDSKISHPYLIVVYKIDQYQTSPYLLIHEKSFGAGNEMKILGSSRVELYSPQKGHDRVAILSSDGKKAVLYSFRINPMSISLQSDQDKSWSSKDNLVIEYLGENGQVKVEKVNLYSIFGRNSTNLSSLFIWVFWMLGLLVAVVLVSTIVFMLSYCCKSKFHDISADGQVTYYKNPLREQHENEKADREKSRDDDPLCTTLMEANE